MKPKVKSLEWLRAVGVTASLAAIIGTGAFTLSNRLVWEGEKQDILLYIKENEVLRREESLCLEDSSTALEYKRCMDSYERERDLRSQSWFR